MNRKSMIKYETNGGSEIAPTLIEYAFIVDVPIPEKFGYNFAGWCIDKELKEEFDPNKIIEADLTLYAKWNNYNPKQFINDMSVYTNLSNVVKDYQEIYSNGLKDEQIENKTVDAKQERIQKCEYVKKLNEEYTKNNTEYYRLFVLLNDAKKVTEKIQLKMDKKISKKGEEKSSKIIALYNEIKQKEEKIQAEFDNVVLSLDQLNNDYEEFASNNR